MRAWGASKHRGTGSCGARVARVGFGPFRAYGYWKLGASGTKGARVTLGHYRA